MDCKEAQILLAPHIMGDLDSNSRSHELEVHLFSCQACSQEYKAIKETIGFIDEHKALFAEAFETKDTKRATEQEEMKRSWQGIQAKLAKIEAQGKQAKIRRFFAGVSAAAACFAIGISVLLMLSNSKTLERRIPPQIALAPAPSIKIELLSNNGNITIPAGTKVRTTAGELKTVIINDKHRIVMNSDTALSIELLLYNECTGCMVKLGKGEIFACVEHDGNPFVVSTAHGKAVITGTTFDIKTTDVSTTLVVVEGTVQFESEKGLVQVKTGQISKIAAHSIPTGPASCNASELTAWATSHEIEAALARMGAPADDYDPSDLWTSVLSGPIDLEEIDYDDWVEEKRDWFEREFPWIFQLKEALAKEGIEVGYPELLIQSGDLWQFACPAASPGRIPALDVDSLLKLAGDYSRDKEWLLVSLPGSKHAMSGRAGSKEQSFGLKALKEWDARITDAQRSLTQLDADTLLYSLHAGVYLANTRTLAWLSIKNDKCVFRAEDKTGVLALFQSQVNTANDLTKKIIMLLCISQNQPCGEYQGFVDKIIEDISEITTIEKRILEYEGRE